MPKELSFIQRFDEAKQAVQQIVDIPYVQEHDLSMDQRTGISKGEDWRTVAFW
jgi:hypothetical protein